MATNTPKRMVGPKQLANSDTLEYTAPAGGAVVRMCRFENPTTGDITVTASVGADAAGTRFYDAYTIPANSIFSEPLNIPLTNGETLRLHANTTTLGALVTGYEIS